ncbi:MAG: hypothetical protein WAP35_08170, partial [Solirubrobacterales bacterium]
MIASHRLRIATAFVFCLLLVIPATVVAGSGKHRSSKRSQPPAAVQPGTDSAQPGTDSAQPTTRRGPGRHGGHDGYGNGGPRDPQQAPA